MINLPKRVIKKPKEGEYTTIKLPNDLITSTDKLIGTHGFKSRGEIVKEALRDLLAHYQKTEQQELPRFEHFNKGPNGVRITDRKQHRIADINFKPEQIFCELCQNNTCEHIDFALTVPEIQKIIQKRRKEGWKLPDT